MKKTKIYTATEKAKANLPEYLKKKEEKRKCKGTSCRTCLTKKTENNQPVQVGKPNKE